MILGGRSCDILKRMGILERYEKQFPEANKPASQWQPSSEYGFWVRLVIKLSGGRIQDEAKANSVLVIAVVVMFVISFFMVFGVPGFSSYQKPFIPKNLGIIPP